MKEMSNAVKSISTGLLQLFVDSAYRFSEQTVMNEVINIYKNINFEIISMLFTFKYIFHFCHCILL
jgi:hypothetical protein